MSTTNKDFKVKNGIQVSEGGTFGGPVSVGTPTDPSHAVTVDYLNGLSFSGSATTSDTPPDSPSAGDLWFDTSSGAIFLYYDAYWVQIMSATGPQGPQGEPGNDGAPGADGQDGATGPSNVLSIGTVSSGTTASATITGTSPTQTLNLVLPKGDKGDQGIQGIKGDKGDTGNTGPAGTTDYTQLLNKPDLTGYASKTGAETLTNKTIALGSNTVSGTTAQFNTALTDDNFVTINGFEYPKNKTFDNTNRLMGAYQTIAGFDTNQGDYGPTNTSNPIIYIGGSTANSNFSLPSTSALNYGEAITVVNTSSVTINIKTNSGTLINVSYPGHVWKYTYTNATGTGIVDGWMAHQIGISNGRVTLNATTINDDDPLTIKSKNGHGGATFAGIATLTNTGTGATNINKFIRLNPTGGLEIINSAYTANIFTLADSGDVSGINNLSTNGNINGVALNNNGWTGYTPALSTESGSWTIGNGSIDATYKQIGKTVHFRCRVTFGSTTSVGSGTLNIGLPVTAANANYQFPVSILDNGLAWYEATANGMYLNNTSKFAMICQSGGSSRSSEGVTATSPFTFGSGDYIAISGTYEAA